MAMIPLCSRTIPCVGVNPLRNAPGSCCWPTGRHGLRRFVAVRLGEFAETDDDRHRPRLFSTLALPHERG